MTSELKLNHVHAMPLDVAWKLAKQAACGKLLLELLPLYFTSIETLEGGAGAGTVREITLGEGVGPEGAGKKVKERVDVVDEATHTISYSIIEGGDPRYQAVKFTLKFAAAGDSTAVEKIMHYTPVNDAVPPPEHFEAMSVAAGNAMNAYAKEHAAELA